MKGRNVAFILIVLAFISVTFCGYVFYPFETLVWLTFVFAFAIPVAIFMAIRNWRN